jgi:peptidoglycan hydrolase-like protein with peptidoglycan-binding domain
MRLRIILQAPVLLGLAWLPGLRAAPNEGVHHTQAEGNKIVKKAQKKLHKQGYYQGEVDGLNGDATAKAVREFQRTRGIAVTGRLDTQTLDALDIDYDVDRDGPIEDAAEETGEGLEKAASATEKGVRAGGKATGKGLEKAGEAVHDVFDKDSDKNASAKMEGATKEAQKAQKKLASLGYYDGKVDGMMGPETEEAIRKFQQKQNLPVTGRLDEQTRKELKVD